MTCDQTKIKRKEKDSNKRKPAPPATSNVARSNAATAQPASSVSSLAVVDSSETKVEPAKRLISRKRAKRAKTDSAKQTNVTGAGEEIAAAINQLASSPSAKVKIAQQAVAASCQASDNKLIFQTPPDNFNELQLEYLYARRKQVMERFWAAQQNVS